MISPRLGLGCALLVVACGDEVSSVTGDGDGDITGFPDTTEGAPSTPPGPPGTPPSQTTANPHGSDDDGPSVTTTAGPEVCGDGLVTGFEQCDGMNLGDGTCALDGFGPYSTGLACGFDCRFDFSECEEGIPPLCGDGILDDFEQCDGDDFAGLTCEDLGWDAGELLCTPSCTISDANCQSLCGDGRVGANEECDGGPPIGPGGEPLTCDQLFGPGASGEILCWPDCTIDISLCTECGNGLVEGDEQCDGNDFAGLTCEAFGFSNGQLACAFGCQIDTSGCSSCGNGIIDMGEVCDGPDLGGLDCTSLGFAGGSLACDANCQHDVSSCGSCGDGIAEAGEACDGADLGGATCDDIPGALAGEVTCTPDCELDGSACLMAFEGALVISEVLYAPLESPLAVAGQWFEIHNYDVTQAYSLQGCLVHSNGAFETFEIDAPLDVPANGYVALATPDGKEDLGFQPDFLIPPGFVLANGGDTITLECGGVPIDTVVYDDEMPWPGTPPGVSISLHPALLGPAANNDGTSWCAAVNEYGIGQLGTPAGPNTCM